MGCLTLHQGPVYGSFEVIVTYLQPITTFLFVKVYFTWFQSCLVNWGKLMSGKSQGNLYFLTVRDIFLVELLIFLILSLKMTKQLFND